VLRDDAELGGERAPQPRFADIPALVLSTERSGIDLAFQWSGERVEKVSDVAGLAAYRIVQEALSNAIRHAPGAPVFVDVAHNEEAIVISVVNTAPPVAHDLSDPGHGIVGMRERVASVGGSLETVPTSDGGFAVRAIIPLQRVS
jgi:signal transduction histidine kinase